MATLVMIILIALSLLPVIKVTFDKVRAEVSANQYNLLTKVIGDAVSHVQQVSTTKDISSEDKKSLAVELSTKIALNLKIPASLHNLVADLIESALWKDEQESGLEEDEDEDENFE